MQDQALLMGAFSAASMPPDWNYGLDFAPAVVAPAPAEPDPPAEPEPAPPSPPEPGLQELEARQAAIETRQSTVEGRQASFQSSLAHITNALGGAQALKAMRGRTLTDAIEVRQAEQQGVLWGAVDARLLEQEQRHQAQTRALEARNEELQGSVRALLGRVEELERRRAPSDSERLWEELQAVRMRVEERCSCPCEQHDDSVDRPDVARLRVELSALQRQIRVGHAKVWEAQEELGRRLGASPPS